MTNGISFRRWLFEANPSLTTLLTGTLGERVLDDPDELTAARTALPTMPSFVAALRGDQARQQGGAGQAHPRT